MAVEAFRDNPDTAIPEYQGACGMYPAHCGLGQLLLSFGHDEYLYRVLLENRGRHRLPLEYADIIRYHSFYPWHTHHEYAHLMEKRDAATLRAVRDFNQFDLYSKEEEGFEVTDEMVAYYRDLLDRYFPVALRW